MIFFKFFVTVFCFTFVSTRVIRTQEKMESASLLTLPANATSLREDIVDTFNCTEKEYGYYADVDNDCQVFHVCLPVNFGHSRSTMYRWSFICPESTVFNQEILTCMRQEDSIPCEDSPMFYHVNSNFGNKNESDSSPSEVEDMTNELQNSPETDELNQMETIEQNQTNEQKAKETETLEVDLRNDQPTSDQLIRRRRGKKIY